MSVLLCSTIRCHRDKSLTMDNLHVRLIFDLGKKKFRKELIKISKVAKYLVAKCCKIRKI